MSDIGTIRKKALALLDELHTLIGKDDDVSIKLSTHTVTEYGENGYYVTNKTTKKCVITIGAAP